MIEQDLSRIADALEKLVQIESARRFNYKLTFSKELMPVYKSDHTDFDFRVILSAPDNEGNIIQDAPIPAGYTLVVSSDNPAALSVVQDLADPRLVHCHVGGPNPDGTPSQANVTANVFDPANNLVATGADQATVTVGDPQGISTITVRLPE